MKLIINFLLLTIISTFISCEECGECFTPPAPFIFELVNQQGENVFTAGNYIPEQLSIEEITTNQNFEFQFISENNLNIIEIGSIGWTTEEVNLSFQLTENKLFTFYVNAERKSEDCCSFTRYSDITIEGATFELDNQTGIYKVIVE